MAQKTTVQLIDDITGKEADETVTFSVDGVSYEIDLSVQNAEKLRGALEPYVTAGRRTSGSRASAQRRFSSSRSAQRGGTNPKDIREWASKSGIELSPRGRIPSDVVKRYEEANR